MVLQHLLPLTCVAIGAALSAMLTGLVRRLSTRHGFVDLPGGHKAHHGPVALGGGVAITLAATMPMLAAIAAAQILARSATEWLPPDILRHFGGIQTKTPMAVALVGCTWLLCVVGLLDDRRAMSAGTKFLIQVGVASLLVFGFNLRLLSGMGYAPSAVLSILWIVTLTNSFNFLDNMDGLAAGVAAIAACVFAATAMQAGQIFVPACAFLLVGALAGFLPFNMYPAKIFMGDAGSLPVGLLLAVLTILTTFADPAHNQSPLGVIAPLVVMAVPLYDTISVLLLRWRLGHPLWKGDRRHFSHRLVRRGMHSRKAVLVIWLATLVTALPALLLPTAGWLLAWGVLLQTLLVVILVALLESDGPNDLA